MEKNNFFDWFVSLFKKEKVEIPQKTQFDIEFEKKWNAIKRNYRLEYLETYNAYFVQYCQKGEWFYLRHFDEDFTLDRARGNAIRLANPDDLDNIMRAHQDWIDEGHVFMTFD